MAASYYYSEDAGRYTLLGYGIFVLIGGLIAWFRRRSRVSLLSSALSAVILLGAFVLSFWWPVIAFAIGAIVAINLAINFAVRLQSTRKFMPAGMLMLVSLAIFIFLVLLAAAAPIDGLPAPGKKAAADRSSNQAPNQSIDPSKLGLVPGGGGGGKRQQQAAASVVGLRGAAASQRQQQGVVFSTRRQRRLGLLG